MATNLQITCHFHNARKKFLNVTLWSKNGVPEAISKEMNVKFEKTLGNAISITIYSISLEFGAYSRVHLEFTNEGRL